MTAKTHYFRKEVRRMSSKREERKKAKMIEKMEAETCEYNKVKKPTNVVLNVLLAVMSLISILPFIFVVIISLTDEQTSLYRKSSVSMHTTIL